MWRRGGGHRWTGCKHRKGEGASESLELVEDVVDDVEVLGVVVLGFEVGEKVELVSGVGPKEFPAARGGRRAGPVDRGEVDVVEVCGNRSL